VLIDCAFFGICGNVTIDLNHRCITDITFSISKTFPVSHLRVGMRLTRTDDDDSLLVHNKTNYTNRLGAGVGLELIRRYDADWNWNTWRTTQVEFCQQLGVEPSDTVIFGIDSDPASPYNRGGKTGRMCFAKFLYNKQLPND
jgi:hypothetical protein